MILSLITEAIGVGRDYIKGKADVSKAKAEAEATALKTAAKSVADWEKIQATNAKTSWKDEWLTLLFSIPLIGAFWPDAVPHIQAGFEALAEMPEWYHTMLMIVVSASFGVRIGGGLVDKLKKK